MAFLSGKLACCLSAAGSSSGGSLALAAISEARSVGRGLPNARALCKQINRLPIVLDPEWKESDREGDRESGRKCETSTNIRRLGVSLKQGQSELPTESKLTVSSKSGAGSPSFEKASPVRRGRPRKAETGQVVSCRLPAEELRAFDALCDQLGAKSRSDGLRSIVRMAAGFLEFSREDSAQLDEIRFELHKIGVNVNQIALAANRGRSPMVKAQWSAIDDLRRSLPSLRTVLTQVVSERRRRGTALFRRFAAEAREAGNG